MPMAATVAMRSASRANLVSRAKLKRRAAKRVASRSAARILAVVNVVAVIVAHAIPISVVAAPALKSRRQQRVQRKATQNKSRPISNSMQRPKTRTQQQLPL